MSWDDITPEDIIIIGRDKMDITLTFSNSEAKRIREILQKKYKEKKDVPIGILCEKAVLKETYDTEAQLQVKCQQPRVRIKETTKNILGHIIHSNCDGTFRVVINFKPEEIDPC